MLRLFAFVFASAVVPSVASAALALQVGPSQGANAADAVVAPGSGEHFFDVVFHETPPTENEGLFTYDFTVTTPGLGVRLLGAQRPDNWVLTDPNATFTVIESTPTRTYLNGTASTVLSDITEGKQVARIFYAVDPAAAPGEYRHD